MTYGCTFGDPLRYRYPVAWCGYAVFDQRAELRGFAAPEVFAELARAGRDVVGPLAGIGVTWWDERTPWDDIVCTEPLLRQIGQGPPRI